MAGKKRTKFEAGNNCEEWVYKCLDCKHSYTKRSNVDEIYCSLKKECRYEEVKNGK